VHGVPAYSQDFVSSLSVRVLLTDFELGMMFQINSLVIRLNSAIRFSGGFPGIIDSGKHYEGKEISELN